MTSSVAQFTTLESIIAPLPIDNIDTDQIIPARYLKITDRSTIAEGLFANWRYDGGDEALDLNPQFVLNQERFAGAQILLAGDNFGCGSSREHAPWALLGNGIRAVLSTRFADIFRNNSLKNGLLPVQIDAATSQELFEATQSETPPTVHLDLEHQTLRLHDGRELHFDVDPFAKACLLQGVDQLGYLVEQLDAIRTHESASPARIETLSAQRES